MGKRDNILNDIAKARHTLAKANLDIVNLQQILLDYDNNPLRLLCADINALEYNGYPCHIEEYSNALYFTKPGKPNKYIITPGSGVFDTIHNQGYRVGFISNDSTMERLGIYLQKL